jgi:hypothetical protein
LLIPLAVESLPASTALFMAGIRRAYIHTSIKNVQPLRAKTGPTKGLFVMLSAMIEPAT